MYRGKPQKFLFGNFMTRGAYFSVPKNSLVCTSDPLDPRHKVSKQRFRKIRQIPLHKKQYFALHFLCKGPTFTEVIPPLRPSPHILF